MLIAYTDLLQTLAEVAITFAGFIGVVLVFQRTMAPETVAASNNSIFHMLLCCFGLLSFSLLPLMLLPALSDEQLVLQICTPLMGTVHFIGAVKGLLEGLRGDTIFPRSIGFPIAFVSIVLFVSSVSIGFGYLAEHAAWIYMAGLGLFLVVAIVSFASFFRTSA